MFSDREYTTEAGETLIQASKIRFRTQNCLDKFEGVAHLIGT